MRHNTGCGEKQDDKKEERKGDMENVQLGKNVRAANDVAFKLQLPMSPRESVGKKVQ